MSEPSKFTPTMRGHLEMLTRFLEQTVDKNPSAKSRETAWSHGVALKVLMETHDELRAALDALHSEEPTQPHVLPERRVNTGVALIVQNADGQVLMGQRRGSHGEGTYSFIGGWMKHGEGFLDTAKREALEEAGIVLFGARVVHAMSTVFPDRDVHSVTVLLKVPSPWWSGIPKAMEPNKLDGEWQWFDPDHLPSPLFKPLADLGPDLRPLLDPERNY